METLALGRPPTKRRCWIKCNGFRFIPAAPSMTLTIGTEEWELHLAERIIDDSDGGNCAGLCAESLGTPIIAITNAIAPAQRWKTFWHELGHAADFSLNPDSGRYNRESLARTIEFIMHWIDLPTIERIAEYLGAAEAIRKRPEVVLMAS